MKEHFYIKSLNKEIYHKINYDDVIMVDKWLENSRIHRADKSYVYVAGEVHDVYKRYLAGIDNFIRASAYFIVNVNHIVTATTMPDLTIELALENNHKATLRNAHPYAAFIKTEQVAKRKVRGRKKISHSEEKDAIIMNSSEDAIALVDMIMEATKEVVTVAYIRKRYKDLCSQ